MSPIRHIEEAERNSKAHPVEISVVDWDYPRKQIILLSWVVIQSQELVQSWNKMQLLYILRWMIKLERIDIITKMLLLLSHLALSREGHLDVTVHLMAYVCQKHISTLIWSIISRNASQHLKEMWLVRVLLGCWGDYTGEFSKTLSEAGEWLSEICKHHPSAVVL